MWFEQELTMAVSWELLAWAMPRMLVVCITSTEKLGSQLAMRDPVRRGGGFYRDGQVLKVNLIRTKVSPFGFVPRLPSKWKKWLWLMCGLASAAAPTGPMFSSKPAPCCWLPTWPPSPMMFREVRQVGQEVSCSSHDRRHELGKKKQNTNTFIQLLYLDAL